MKWKNKLKTVLAETSETKNSGICLEKALTKTDKTPMNIVSSVFVSGQLRDNSEKKQNIEVLPNCSNCDLQMIFTQNDDLFFCPLGCESQVANAEKEQRNNQNAAI